MAIRIYLVDDHEVVRRGLRELIELEGDLEIVGEAGTAGMALAGIAKTEPDVAVLDVRLPDGNGVEVCRDAGYLLKDIRGADLIDAIRRVAAGDSLLDPALTGKVLQRLREGDQEDPRLASLSEQERRILAHIADGLTNREIGVELHLAEKTVKNYVSNLLAKLDMQRRTEAAVFYTQVTRAPDPRTD